MPLDDAGPDLLKRAAAIRLTLAQIAREAGLDKHTVANLRAGRDGVRQGTVRKVAQVVVQHERAALAHLLALHPLPQERAA